MKSTAYSVYAGLGALVVLSHAPTALAQKPLSTAPPALTSPKTPAPAGGWLGGGDECTSPTPITGTGTFNFDNSAATTSFEGQNEPLCAQYGVPGIDNNVWFEWTAPADGTAVLDTCGGANFDTKVAVYDGGACPADGTALSCNDNVCGVQSATAWTAVSGQTYLIQLGSYPGAGTGTGTFDLEQNTIGGILGFYDAGDAGNPATAPDPTTAGWTEMDPSSGGVTVMDVSPDGGSGLNAWQVADNDSVGAGRRFYEELFGPEAVAIARHTGWELSATMRMVDGADYTTFFEYSTGFGTVHERYHLWFRAAGIDIEVRVLGPTGPTYVLPNGLDGNYHDFVLRKPAGQDMLDAEIEYDGNVIGPAPPAGATASNADGGVRWGAGNDSNTGTANWNNVTFKVGNPISGAPYCFGDGASVPCPCGNPGSSDSGCANSTGGGAILGATGSNSVSADDLAFNAENMLPNQPALLFVGTNAVNMGDGVFFGDGLRCAGQGVVRLGVQSPDGAGAASWGPGLAASGGWVPGDDRYFQTWYRDPSGSPCGAGFNLSNGFRVSFQP